MECDLPYNTLSGVVVRNKILPAKKEKKRLKNSCKMFFDKYQEDYIHSILFFSGKITEVTFESKMNLKYDTETTTKIH